MVHRILEAALIHRCSWCTVRWSWAETRRNRKSRTDAGKRFVKDHKSLMASNDASIIPGRKACHALALLLNLGQGLADAASRWFNLAVTYEFTKGRKQQYVIAACLYIACRKAKNDVMLIDFSDKLAVGPRVRVFGLATDSSIRSTSLNWVAHISSSYESSILRISRSSIHPFTLLDSLACSNSEMIQNGSPWMQLDSLRDSNETGCKRVVDPLVSAVLVSSWQRA